MNKNAKKWCEALLSGDYKQGKGWLCKEGLYCCLGVACDLYQKEMGDLNISKCPIGDSLFSYNLDEVVSYDGRDKYLPPKVISWLGMTSNSGDFQEIIDYDGNAQISATCLAFYNDGGASFPKIVDLIKKHEKELFEQD